MTAPVKPGAPPWWQWYEPPSWFPRRLHLLTCTFCRGMASHCREQERARRAGKVAA